LPGVADATGQDRLLEERLEVGQSNDSL
jgi:hypothetical protein